MYQTNRPTPPVFTNPVITGEVQHSILKAYIWMFVGLAVSGITAYFCYASHFLDYMYYSLPWLPIILLVAQIGVAIGFGVSLNRFSATTMKVLFLAYALMMGISMASIGYTYTDGIIGTAFFISALYFGCLVIVGFTTKADLTRFRSILFTGLIVLIISQVIMLFFPVSWATRLICIFGLLLFTGITAYDVQRLNKTMLYSQGQPVAQEKWAIFFAFELYLDFINIFLYILQLLGSGSNNRR